MYVTVLLSSSFARVDSTLDQLLHELLHKVLLPVEQFVLIRDFGHNNRLWQLLLLFRRFKLVQGRVHVKGGHDTRLRPIVAIVMNCKFVVESLHRTRLNLNLLPIHQLSIILLCFFVHLFLGFDTLNFALFLFLGVIVGPHCKAGCISLLPLLLFVFVYLCFGGFQICKQIVRVTVSFQVFLSVTILSSFVPHFLPFMVR